MDGTAVVETVLVTLGICGAFVGGYFLGLDRSFADYDPKEPRPVEKPRKTKARASGGKLKPKSPDPVELEKIERGGGDAPIF